MNLMAIDASTKSSGIAIFKDGELIEYKCVTSTSSDKFTRIFKMIDEIEKLYVEHQIDTIIMEEVLPEDVRHNQNTFKALMYLQAYIVGTMHTKYKQDIQLYEASHWRKLCGIKTGAGVKRESLKPKDIAFVKQQYNLLVNDDVADAICIGHAFLIEQGLKPKCVIEERPIIAAAAAQGFSFE